MYTDMKEKKKVVLQV